MPSIHAPSEVSGDALVDTPNVVLVAAGAGTGEQFRRLLDRAPGVRHELTEADAETAAARVSASQANAPVCVIVVHEPPVVDAFDLLAAWAEAELLDRGSVVVVTDGRDARRAALRAGAMACIDRSSLDENTLVSAIEDAIDRFAAAALSAARDRSRSTNGWAHAEINELRNRLEHTQQLRRLADAVPAYIYYVDAQQRFVFVNQTCVEHFQRPANDAVGRTVAELCGAANYQSMRPSLEAALRGERVRREEKQWLANGSVRQLDASYVPDRRADGSIAGCFVLATDITERKQVEDLTRRVLDTLFTFVVILDVDGTLIEANEAPLRSADITIDHVRGKKFWECFWWEHSPEVQAQLRGACERAAQGETVRCDVPVRVVEDVQMTMDFQVAPLRDHEGRVTYLIPSAVDITNRARAEQQLRQSEERSRLAQRAGQVGTWEFDSATGVTFWSDAMWDIYGRSPSPDLNPDDMFRVSLHPQDVHRVQEWAAATLVGEEGLREVFRVVRPDRTIRWVESTATVTRATDDGSIRMVGVNIDITERKQAEQVLRESEERLRMAKDAASLGIHDFDIRAGALRWDERVRELWGLGPGEAITFEAVISGIHPDDRAAMRAEFHRALDPRGDGSGLAEFRVTSRASGEMRWAAATGQTTFEDGQAVRLVGTVQDVTARKQAEEALRQSQERLREADRRKDEFLAMLGHELRNPLAAIRSASELLQLFASEDTRLDRVYSVLERQSNHMVRLIDGLLEVSRIARGKIHLEPKAVDLREVLEGVLHDRSDQFTSGGLELETDFPDEPLWVWGDDVRVAQIFDNLVGNAMKFTQGPGTISVGFWREGPLVVIRVKDTGVGIRPEMLSCIFEAFQQDTQGMARGAGGLGLGLALVRGLVELHGGTVEARSEGVGWGAQFEVRLPLSSAAPEPNLRDQAPQARRWRVLIVEDNVDAAQMLQELLEIRGHTVTLAGSGLDALEYLREKTGDRQADVVLCDIGLPGMSGYEVAKAIRRDALLGAVRVVALTGYGQPDDRKRAAEAGFDDHLIKPIDLEALEQLLARLR